MVTKSFELCANTLIFYGKEKHGSEPPAGPDPCSPFFTTMKNEN